jgi:hypothetical protein
MPQTMGWARIWYAAKREDDVTLRQGAWYPVVGGGATEVVLDVSGQRVRVPQDTIELRSHRPDRFTVVYRTWDDPNPVHGTMADVGRTYAVCPMCASRVRLPKRPRLGTTGVWAADGAERAKCRRCGHEGIVAWWETG